MRPRKLRLNEAQQNWVRDWWRALQPRTTDEPPLPGELWIMGRSERAQLRRCTSIEELLIHPSTLLLAQRLIALNGDRRVLLDEPITYERLAWIAGVLAFVKGDIRDGRSLAFQLGHASNRERPAMSELRFKALQRCPTTEDLFRHWRRAIQLAEGKTDVVRLADDLLSWQIELGRSATRASDGIKFHWACDYYLSARERDAAKEPETNKEIHA